MDNEFLRYENNPNLKSKEVSFTSFNKKNNQESNKKHANSLWSFINEEEISFNKKILLEESAPVEKPKLGEAVNLFIVVLLLNVLLVNFCSLTNNIFFLFILIFLSSVTIPISIMFFFYKLNTRSKISVINVIKFLGIGAFAFLIMGGVLDKALITNLNYNYIVLSIKNCIEFLTVLIIVWLSIKSIKCQDIMTIMYIASIISGGYAMAKCMVELVEIVFIRVQITNNGVVSAVGAIINNSDSVKISIKALIDNILYIAMYKTSLFILIMVISSFAIRNLMFRNENNLSAITLWLLIVFSVSINAFSLLNPSIKFLKILYMIFSISITSYLFLNVIDSSIKMENYK